MELDLTLDRRLPDSIEVAAYYVVAESLTNAAKYAAALVNVLVDTHDATLRLLEITGPPGSGTSVHIGIPLGGK